MPRRKPFRLPERIITLEFEDGPYQGFELDVSLTVPQSVFWWIATLTDDDRPEEPTERGRQERDALLRFGRQIRGWNLEGPDGAPIPATPEAFADELDPYTQGLIVARWLAAIRKPPDPLSPGRNGHGTSARKPRPRRSKSSAPKSSTP
jgi:hypothetical protein